MRNRRSFTVQLRSPKARSRSKLGTTIWGNIDLAAAFKVAEIGFPSELMPQPIIGIDCPAEQEDSSLQRGELEGRLAR